MTYTLENGALQLTVNPRLARWSLISRLRNGPSLEGIQVGLSYRRGLAYHNILDRWPSASVSDPQTVASPHGSLRQFELVTGADDLLVTLTFGLPGEEPLLFWKMTVENRGQQPVHIDRLDLLSGGFIYRERSGLGGAIRLIPAPQPRAGQKRTWRRLIPGGELAFFSNGWQSWSYAGVYGAGDRFHRTRLGPLRTPTDVNAGTPQPGLAGMFASDMFGVLGDRQGRNAILAGFLSQKNHFGSLETWIGASPPALRLWANGDGARLDPGEKVVSDWACLSFFHLDAADPLGPYLEAVGREHGLADGHRSLAEPPTGWCSWYQFSSEDYVGAVTAGDIRRNREAIAALQPGLPLQVIQIDDGFESQVGDWLSFNPGFPHGVGLLAAEIRQSGFKPGLWLAPFIVHPRSRLAADHPDWLLRGRLGRPVNAGFGWGAFNTALDLTHPATLEYVREVVQTATQAWGFPYLKLDFLYAAALPGRYGDPRRTRAQVLRAGLEAVRAAAGEETFLLGCSCPLGPAIGLVDAMRIGADTARRWLPSFKGIEFFLKGEPNLPSARNASHNALTRAALHRRWWINDPDCLLLRPETRLTLAEVQTLATVIALSGGSLLLSDDLPRLPADRLRIAEALLPLIGQRPHVLDWFDSATPKRVQLDLDGPAGPWHLLALFNWDDQPQELTLNINEFYLPLAQYYVRSFWRADTRLVTADEPAGGTGESALTYAGVPAHGVVLLALRPYRPHRPQYLGGDLHISQGLELAAWEPLPEGVNLRLNRPGRAQGHIELALPRPPRLALQDGQAMQWDASGEGRYLFDLELNRFTSIEVRY
ncbi:MAG TPA: glycoside hydrolase family 36 protein [Anaerolineales bacterium]|nr:glycoside hydrolase family 36 protein [Anaerolineales bacterium]